ncbi:hypothetical protein KSD_42170 [Ktedonobacter sp. SOSP1-85]|nr:hypothetical protein KSD_42170 [Ktedonobacter sp. SOSP1-85]
MLDDKVWPVLTHLLRLHRNQGKGEHLHQGENLQRATCIGVDEYQSIERTKERIFSLPKVTPQIVEKIVKSFMISRSIGDVVGNKNASQLILRDGFKKYLAFR